MNDNLKKLITGLNTTPFLFVGSGITRRYYNLPDWKGLLTIFARKIKDDEFSYPSYESRAKAEDNEVGIYPLIASYIEKDFNEKWFNDPSIRSEEENVRLLVLKGVSAFKAEISAFIDELFRRCKSDASQLFQIIAL